MLPTESGFSRVLAYRDVGARVDEARREVRPVAERLGALWPNEGLVFRLFVSRRGPAFLKPEETAAVDLLRYVLGVMSGLTRLCVLCRNGRLVVALENRRPEG